jgi:hypothetical protein
MTYQTTIDDQLLEATPTRPTEPNPDTQEWFALAAIRRGPLCSYAFYRQEPRLTHRLAAAVHRLRQRGHRIATRPCDGTACGTRHESNAVVYYLT